MSNFDRAGLLFPSHVFAIHKPSITGQVPSSYHPAYSAVSLLPGTMISVGRGKIPRSVGSLVVEEGKQQAISLPAGYGTFTVDGFDEATPNSVLFRANSDQNFFVLERQAPVLSFHDIASPSSTTLHLLEDGDTIELRGGDIVVAWNQENTNWARTWQPMPLNILDMQAAMLILPEFHSREMHSLLLQNMLSIWERIQAFMSSWDSHYLQNGVTIVKDQGRYGTYESSQPDGLEVMKSLTLPRTKRRMSFDDDDEWLHKKMKI